MAVGKSQAVSKLPGWDKRQTKPTELSRNKKKVKVYYLAPCDGFRNPESEESKIWEIFACGIRNMGFGVRNTSQGSRNPITSTTWSPESKTISWIPLHWVNYHYILYNIDFASWSWISFQSILVNAILGLLSFSSLFDTYKEFNLETGDDTQNSCEAHLQKSATTDNVRVSMSP